MRSRTVKLVSLTEDCVVTVIREEGQDLFVCISGLGTFDTYLKPIEAERLAKALLSMAKVARAKKGGRRGK